MSDAPAVAHSTSVSEVIAQMEDIDSALPATDGLRIFNHMYLGVTQKVNETVKNGEFGDPDFVERLDVIFANLYFDAVNAVDADPASQPKAWQPLLQQRQVQGIEPIQFALAGMNAHINHDLPVAVISTCTDLNTEPDTGSHRADYQKIDGLLDQAEADVRESLLPARSVANDPRLATVSNIVANWSINSARDAAWDTAVALWDVRDVSLAERLALSGLARTVAMASRCLLVPI